MAKKTVGEKIKEAVKLTGMTNYEFCKKIGVGENIISRWYSGDRNPSIRSLKKIAKETKLPLSYFLNDDSQKNFIENTGTIGAVGNNNTVNMQLQLKDHEIRLLKLENEILKLKINKK